MQEIGKRHRNKSHHRTDADVDFAGDDDQRCRPGGDADRGRITKDVDLVVERHEAAGGGCEDDVEHGDGNEEADLVHVLRETTTPALRGCGRFCCLFKGHAYSPSVTGDAGGHDGVLIDIGGCEFFLQRAFAQAPATRSQTFGSSSISLETKMMLWPSAASWRMMA